MKVFESPVTLEDEGETVENPVNKPVVLADTKVFCFNIVVAPAFCTNTFAIIVAVKPDVISALSVLKVAFVAVASNTTVLFALTSVIQGKMSPTAKLEFEPLDVTIIVKDCLIKSELNVAPGTPKNLIIPL